MLWKLGATTTVARARCRWSPTRGPRRLVQRRWSERRRRPSAVRRNRQAGKRGAGQVALPGPARPASGGASSVRPSWASQAQPAPPCLGPVVDRRAPSSSFRSFVVPRCLLAGWLAGYGGGVGLVHPNPRLASHALDARALATGPVGEHGTRSVCSSTRSSNKESSSTKGRGV